MEERKKKGRKKKSRKNVYKEHNLTPDKHPRQTNSATVNIICSVNMRNSSDSDMYNTNVIAMKTMMIVLNLSDHDLTKAQGHCTLHCEVKE